ncbi:uracil phosphoribosyltransferase [Microbispora corallina]|uniref:Uracil phosphoribosyltransferase n=1 Tax=Microbispora corallina TaxID=83302 RepID=A0ABQ4G0X9_9ACTN|nr:uracil phosphoribosyltransferase [Microbispora corallina]GIH40701.1 uracil phosphoribosyltransferase [Microbispora corallina]
MTTATAAGVGTVRLLPQTRALRALHTVMRDRHAGRDEFVTSSGRVIRQLIETALDLLPFEPREVCTPVGRTYRGLRMTPHICGVSVLRAGDSMESELRAIAPGVRIGKILIQRDKVTKLPHLYYAALPADIDRRHVLLLDPMLATGGTALAAIEVLLGQGVEEDAIVFVTLLSSPEGIKAVHERHPRVRIVTSAVEERLNENAYMIPGIGDFGDRYFGTDVVR